MGYLISFFLSSPEAIFSLLSEREEGRNGGRKGVGREGGREGERERERNIDWLSSWVCVPTTGDRTCDPVPQAPEPCQPGWDILHLKRYLIYFTLFFREAYMKYYLYCIRYQNIEIRF